MTHRDLLFRYAVGLLICCISLGFATAFAAKDQAPPEPTVPLLAVAGFSSLLITPEMVHVSLSGTGINRCRSHGKSRPPH